MYCSLYSLLKRASSTSCLSVLSSDPRTEISTSPLRNSGARQICSGAEPKTKIGSWKLKPFDRIASTRAVNNRPAGVFQLGCKAALVFPALQRCNGLHDQAIGNTRILY